LLDFFAYTLDFCDIDPLGSIKPT